MENNRCPLTLTSNKGNGMELNEHKKGIRIENKGEKFVSACGFINDDCFGICFMTFDIIFETVIILAVKSLSR